ncbi:18692_t:CDS:2, partial [Acaulospora morrowiae]
QELQQCRADKGLLEYNRDRIFDRYYNKFKNNILLNPPQIQISNMIGNGPPLFIGKAGEDPSDWILEFKKFVIASRINVIAGAGGVAGKAEAYNLGISYMVGKVKTWYENKIKSRNWQCDNIFDGTGVNDLNAIQALNNGALTGINANQFLGEALVVRNNAGGDNTITGANIIPADTWDEDWSIAGGHPAPIGTPSSANYANADAGNSIVAPEMTLGQFLYCLEYLYPTVEAQKNLLFFGQITQGGMSILEYNAKISKLGKLAGLPESKMREQYIRGLNPMNQYNVRMMAKYHDTRDNITKALVEAEKFSLLQGNFSFPPSGGQVPNPYEKSINTGLTETEIKNLIKSMMLATQSTASKSQEEQFNQITLSQNNFKKIIVGLKGTIAKGQQTLKKPPGPGKQKADDLAMNRFLDSFIDDTDLPKEVYDYDPIEDLRKQFEDLDINQAKLARIIHT